MLYKAFSWVCEVYPIAVFFLYIGLFLFTFAVTFVMPPLALLTLIFSIFALMPFVLVHKLLKASEKALAPQTVEHIPSVNE